MEKVPEESTTKPISSVQMRKPRRSEKVSTGSFRFFANEKELGQLDVKKRLSQKVKVVNI